MLEEGDSKGAISRYHKEINVRYFCSNKKNNKLKVTKEDK